MWQANKIGIIALALGFAVLGVVFWLLHETEPLLARQIVAGGFCLLLFTVALATWLSARSKREQ